MKKLLVFAEAPERKRQELETAVIFGLSDLFDIQIISELDYLEEYFREPRAVDLLLVEEEFYGPYLDRHQIGLTAVLEEEGMESRQEGGTYFLAAHMPAEEIVELVRGLELE